MYIYITYVCDIELLLSSHKTEITLFYKTIMELEMIILRTTNQTQKVKCQVSYFLLYAESFLNRYEIE